MKKTFYVLMYLLFSTGAIAQEKIDSLDDLIQQMTLTGVGGIEVDKVLNASPKYSYERTKNYSLYTVTVTKLSQDSAHISITCDARKHEARCLINESALIQKMNQLGMKKNDSSQYKINTKQGVEIIVTSGEFGENLYSTETIRQFSISYVYSKPKTNQIKLW